MTDPSFKSFEKASMMPANMIPSNQSYNIIYNINKEETNVTSLCVSRTPQNFGKHIYIIYSSDITKMYAKIHKGKLNFPSGISKIAQNFILVCFF